jgi:Aspartyl protease
MTIRASLPCPSSMKFRIPLVFQRVSGFDCPRPEVTLWVSTSYGFTPLQFIVDTGADFTTIPIPLAQREGIPFTQSASTQGRATGMLGSAEKFRGTLRVRIAGEEDDWPCDFLVSPQRGSSCGPAGLLCGPWAGRVSREIQRLHRWDVPNDSTALVRPTVVVSPLAHRVAGTRCKTPGKQAALTPTMEVP